jgi:uncharacterized protein YggE
MKKFLIVFVLIIGHFSSNSQVPDNQLEVTGFAEVEIDPDIIVLRIATESVGINSDRYKKILSDEKELKKFIQSAGIDTSSFRLDNFTSISTMVKSPPGISSIKITKSYTFHINKAGQLDDIFKKCAQLGYENIHIVRIDHSEIEKIQNELLKKAAQSARQKAEILAENFQIKLKNVTSINEKIGFETNKDPKYCHSGSQNDPQSADRILYHPYETWKYGDNPSKLKLRLAKSVSVKYNTTPID